MIQSPSAWPDASKPIRAAETATTFEPRKSAVSPKQFGKSGADLAPTSGLEPSDPRFLAAQFQHHVCNAVREWMLTRGKTIESFATELKLAGVPGSGSDRLGRVLRGESLLQIVDLVALAARVSEVRVILMNERTWTTTEVIAVRHQPGGAPAAAAGAGS